jgi:hypothetical protein
MSEGAWTAIVGVLIGGLLSPLLSAIGYAVRRRWETEDRRRDDRRQALYALQDALVALSDVHARPPGREGPVGWDRDARAAARAVRVWAARVGDAQIWALVHPPKPGRAVVTATAPVTDLFPAPDELDAINARIRELLAEL